MSKTKKTSEQLADFLSFTRVVTSFCEFAKGSVSDDDKKSQDLMHQLELGTYKERQKFATQLANVRKHRRHYKDYITINEELCEYIKSPEFVKVYRRLEQILGTIRKQERYVEGKRSYNPRILDTLTIRTTSEEEGT